MLADSPSLENTTPEVALPTQSSASFCRAPEETDTGDDRSTREARGFLCWVQGFPSRQRKERWRPVRVRAQGDPALLSSWLNTPHPVPTEAALPGGDPCISQEVAWHSLVDSFPQMRVLSYCSLNGADAG